MGYFITFEGTEGCGKTTQIQLLAERLIYDGHKVVLTREPGGCVISDKIRTILLDADNRNMCPLTELFLYAAARAQHVSEVIRPALTEDAIVLCDRFTDATIAYQCNGRGIARESIDILNDMACEGLRPELTILLACDPQVGLERARRRIDSGSGPREERFELEALAFHHRVQEGYLNLVANDPERFLVIDGSGNIDRIADIIATRVNQRIMGNSNAVC